MNDLNTKFLGNPYIFEVNPKKILKDSFKELWGWNIPDIDLSSKTVKREYLKYHYLILNKLYFDKNHLEYTQKVLDNATKNTITHNRKDILGLLSVKRREKVNEWLSSFNKRQFNEKMLSYPLFYMWEYVNANLEDLKTWNDKQIQFAKQFGLSHLQDVKYIVEILWFNDELNWSTVNLPVITFEWLKTELESVEVSGVLWSINWNSLLLSFASSLKVENFENLYYWAVALWYKEKMWVQNVKMPTMRMISLLTEAKNRFWKPNEWIPGENALNYVITEEWINNLYLEKLDLFSRDKSVSLTPKQIAQIKSNIRSALRGFWYILEIDNNR